MYTNNFYVYLEVLKSHQAATNTTKHFNNSGCPPSLRGFFFRFVENSRELEKLWV